MAEVPYIGAPQREPGFAPTPSVNVGVSPAAFGVNVAEALQHLGQVQEGAGKELFDRAYAMQELHEQSRANAAAADVENQQANNFVNFRELMGKNAVDAYPKYQADLDAVRASGREGLSPQGQLWYDQETRRSTNMFKVNGASHAAQENRTYAIGAADASIESATKSMQAAPDDPKVTEAALQKIRDQVKFKFGDLGGMSPEEVKVKQADAVNKAMNGQIRSLAKDKPIEAQKLFDQAVKDGDLYGEDLTNLSWYIRHQRNTIGARTTAADSMRGAEGGPVLRALFQNETGFRNVMQGNIGDINNLTGDLAQGYFQITGGTWRQFADKAGVDLREYPQPITSPYSVQAKVANVIPLGRWGPSTIAAMRQAGGKLDLSKSLGENLAANGESLGEGIMPRPTLDNLLARGREAAQKTFPDDGEFADAVEDRIRTQFNKEKTDQRDREFNNYQTVEDALTSPMSGTGKLPTTQEELRLALGDKVDSLDSIYPSKREGIQKQLLANAKDPVPLTEERQNAFLKLVGMAGSPDQRADFLSIDPMTLDLPFQQKKEILQLQQRVQKQADESVPMARALMLLGPKITALGLKDDKDNFNLFKGSLTGIMEDFMAENKRPPKNQEIEEMGNTLLQQTATQNFFQKYVTGGSSVSEPWFERAIGADTPEAQKTMDGIRAQYRNQGIEPTDYDVNRLYLRMLYQGMYGKKAPAP